MKLNRRFQATLRNHRGKEPGDTVTVPLRERIV